MRADCKVKNGGGRKRGVGRDVPLEKRWNEGRSVCAQINVDMFERENGRVGNFGMFSLAHLPGEAVMNRKV